MEPIAQSQAQKEVTANENFLAVQPASLFGRKFTTSALLVWGYYGGYLSAAGVPTSIADGTVTLTNSATNYVEATPAGVVSANTTGFTKGSIPLYAVVCAGGTVTSYTDRRQFRFERAELALPSVVSATGSPMTYQNTLKYEADVIVQGGTVSLVEFTRDNSNFYDVGVVAGKFRLSPNDRLRITYTVAPTLTLVPH